MKSPRHRRNVRRGVGFQMLSKQAQERLIKYEYAVIWFMVLIAINSIVWGIVLNVLTGDFNNGIIGAKTIFRRRDFQAMNQRSKDIFYQDLGELINKTYTEAALKAKAENTTAISKSNNINDDASSKTQIQLKPTENTTISETSTAQPKKTKVSHLFRISGSNADDDDNDDEDDENDGKEDDSIEDDSAVENRELALKADRTFLASMTADVNVPLWRQNVSVQFIYSFPFLTEIFAIIWAAMCLVFQSGVSKYWSLPKPWRIVVPSIFVFTMMTLSTLIYTIVASRYLKLFCMNLRHELNYPNLISCGEAMSVLRPIVKRHQFHHDVYLSLFRMSYVLSFLLWAIALVVVVLRYVYAIDFQMVEVRLGYESPPKHIRRSSELSAIKAKSPTRQLNTPLKMLHADERPRYKSEDDFQSAKSNISEAATPLMELPISQTKIV